MAPKATEKKNQNKKAQNTNKDKKQVQEKVASKKNKSAKSTKNRSSGPAQTCCTVLLGTLIVFGLAGALIGFDTYRADGVFEKSHTGQLLKQAGLLPAAQSAWTCTLKYSARGYKWAEEHLPVYYDISCKAVGPYVEFAKELLQLLWKGVKKGFSNLLVLVDEYVPAVTKFVDQYLPGIIESYNKIYDSICKEFHSFLQTKVFVGQWSPQNLVKALNNTHQAAAQYYSWFHDQVDFYAKSK